MHKFADLFTAIDSTTKTNEKVAAMAQYFADAPPEDAAWALYFLSGRKPKQVVQAPKLRAWAAEAAGIPTWLFDESYDAVGDLGEAMALLSDPFPPGAEGRVRGQTRRLSAWVKEILLPLRTQDDATQKHVVTEAWSVMDQHERFIWNKLMTGSLRVGVSQLLVVRALAQVSGLAEQVISHRLMGAWQPTAEFFQSVIAPDSGDAHASRPYPFFLAYPIDDRLNKLKDAATRPVAELLQESLGDVGDWQAEWKWDGIRAQLILRSGQTFLWSRGEENITERFPEITAIGAYLPEGTVIDGEVLPFIDDTVLPFAKLQQRIGRKTLTKKILADIPVLLMAYDLLEMDGEDVRPRPLSWRRDQLAALLEPRSHGGVPHGAALRLSEIANAHSWQTLAEARKESRARNAEGLMLKKKGDPYGVGRVVGSWWKWKIDPYTVDGVLIYAQRGHGKRASLYTDYTFGVWDDGHTQLVPFTKAYSGLTDAEIREVDAFVRRNTVEKFGPVRTVTPALVFELGFEGIQRSSRHKSGIAVRFPRMLRWRRDKSIEEADSLATIRALLPPE